jgi:hypothetical protein
VFYKKDKKVIKNEISFKNIKKPAITTTMSLKFSEKTEFKDCLLVNRLENQREKTHL